MTIVPSAIVMVNNDLVPQVQQQLETQLFIDQTLDGYSFDQMLITNPHYNQTIKKSSLRILIIRNLEEQANRDQVDLVLFLKAGLATSLKNNFGPPILSHQITTLSWKNFCFH